MAPKFSLARGSPRVPQVILPSQIYDNQSRSSPLHLSDSLILRSNTAGTVNAAAMKNPMNQDMEILEIKFELSGALVDGNDTTFGGSIWCDFSMGPIKLTNGAVPCFLFGRAENLTGEYKTDTTDTLGFNAYSWRLPRPLFVPAGTALIPNFTHTGFIPNTVNVRVGYSCRTVTKTPKRVCVPWIAKYVSKAFNPISTAAVDVSSELDLVNPHQDPVHLQRFVGRTLFLPNTGSTGSSEDRPNGFGSQYLTARIMDSYGRPVVRNYTPFRTIFSAQTRSWEMGTGAILDPEAYYIVSLQKAAMTLTPDGVGQSFISLVGWREMENSAL